MVQPFVTQLHLSFITLLDATGQVTRLYGVTSLPTTYLLDREGRLVTVAIGGYDWATPEARAHHIAARSRPAGRCAARV